MLCKSFKNRDFPLMITKKADKEKDSKKKETSVNKEEKKEAVKDPNKSTEIIKDNKVDLNNIVVKPHAESESYQGESILMKDLHLLSEVQ